MNEYVRMNEVGIFSGFWNLRLRRRCSRQTDVLDRCKGASVSGHVKSPTLGRPPDQGMRVVPSGFCHPPQQARRLEDGRNFDAPKSSGQDVIDRMMTRCLVEMSCTPSARQSMMVIIPITHHKHVSAVWSCIPHDHTADTCLCRDHYTPQPYANRYSYVSPSSLNFGEYILSSEEGVQQGDLWVLFCSAA